MPNFGLIPTTEELFFLEIIKKSSNAKLTINTNMWCVLTKGASNYR